MDCINRDPSDHAWTFTSRPSFNINSLYQFYTVQYKHCRLSLSVSVSMQIESGLLGRAVWN